MNRDEAERCVDIAIAALKRGDVEKARKMLKKSLSMHPTERARSLLESVEAQHGKEDCSGTSSGSTNNGNNNNNNENDSSASSSRREEEEKERSTTTSEQEETPKVDDEDVLRVLECSEDYYAVFALEKSATTDEIKKRYRKLALKMHPDRNDSPHAEDAFKVLGRAYACLSNEDKRRIYDQHGVDPDVQRAQGRPAGPTHFRRGPATFTTFDENIDPDELFRFFFGGDSVFGGSTVRPSPFFPFPGGGVHIYRRRPFRTRSSDDDEDEDDDDSSSSTRRRRPRSFFEILQFLFPLIMLLSFIFVSLRGFSLQPSYQDTERLKSQQFSLKKTQFHQTRLSTETLGVPYFVQRVPKTPVARSKLNDEVDRHYMNALNRECEYQTALSQHGRQNSMNEVCKKAKDTQKKWAEAKPKPKPKPKPKTAKDAGSQQQKSESTTSQPKDKSAGADRPLECPPCKD